jgi:AcrR family transcriptional regulator
MTSEDVPVAEEGSQGRSRERYDKRRNEVVDVAAMVFANQGYHATTIDDLVRATNLKRGGLYHYIGAKKDLLLRIHTRFIDPLLEQTRGILASEDAADVKLRNVAHVLMRTIDEYRDQVTVFLHEWRVIKDDPEWKPIRGARREFEDLVEAVMREGCDTGVFLIEDSRLATLAFLGMINYSYQWFIPGGRVTADGVADIFVDIFIGGIAK